MYKILIFVIIIIILILILILIRVYKCFIYKNKEIININKKKGKVLVLYVFHIFNERVKHFFDNCIFYDENIDFIIISNNKLNKCEAPKICKILFRDNIGYDFGGWSDALLTDNLYKNYDYFIFANSSILGPFLSNNFKGKWTDIYLDGLKNNVKLFGSTINTYTASIFLIKKPHVQSYIFSMDKITLEYLINCNIFSITNYAKTFDEAVNKKEILMSTKIIENGWNIGSLLTYYEDIDFTKNLNNYNIIFLGGLTKPFYHKFIWDEYEVVFIKGNRGKFLNINITSNNSYKSY